MINTARLHSDLSRLNRETSLMLATIGELTAEQLVAESRCAGWSRAHVIAHLASNGRTLVKLVDWTLTGQPQQLYASTEARNQEIAQLAALPAAELITRFSEAAAYFSEQSERLSGELAVAEVDLHGKIIPASAIVALRIAEIVIHHDDLQAGWSLQSAEPASLEDGIEAAVRTMRVKKAPGMTLLTDEGDRWVVGDGELSIRSDRAGLLHWLARGQADRLSAADPIPVLPSW